MATASRRGLTIRPILRSADPALPHDIISGDLADLPTLGEALAGARILIHLAARAHVTRDRPAKAAELYWRSYVLATQRLGQAAADVGIEHVVFLSSAKVNGEQTSRDQSFSPSDTPCPVGLSGETKAEAEIQLQNLADAKGFGLTIIRSPLVYGANVRANMATLVRAVDHSFPLPFVRVDNRRSFIGHNNLVDILLLSAGRKERSIFLRVTATTCRRPN